jgi:tetratricopeptide (TPR) repeat protein
MKRLNLTILIVTVALVVSAFGCSGGLSEADLAYNKGNELRKQGLHDQAIQKYHQAIRLDPDNVKAYNNRGNAYCGLGQYQRAIQDYDKAIQLDPDDAPAYLNRGVALELPRFGGHVGTKQLD